MINIACVYFVGDPVSVEKPLPEATNIPFGISMIATILREAKHRVELLVLSPITPIEENIRDFIANFRPQLFCLNSFSTQFSLADKVAEIIKRIDSSIFVSVGGPHTSLNPEETIVRPAIDAICIGEGEKAIVELATQLEKGSYPSSIPNLWIKKQDGEIEKNIQELFNADLDKLPYLDRKMWKPWVADNNVTPAILLGRGCPYKCTYCSNHALSKLSKGRYVRFRSVENIIGEIEYILDVTPQVKTIYFEVETLGAVAEFIYQFCDALAVFNVKRKNPIRFGANFAVTDGLVNNQGLLNKIFSSLRKANFEFLNIGLESGSERIRREILKRPRYTNRNIIRFCKLAKKYSIDINMYVLMAIPSETYNDFKETVQTTRKCQPKMVTLSIFHPYPGTDLHAIAENMSLIVRYNTKKERRASNLKLPNFSSFQIKREFLLFYYNVYRGYWPFTKILVHIARVALSAYPDISHYYRKLKYRNKISYKLSNLFIYREK